MDNTNSRTFRTKLSEFFNTATKKPVAISRGTERFVLMNEKEYLNLKDEVLSLQRNLISMLEVRSGQSETFTNSEEHFSEMFDKVSAKVKKKHHVKKAVG
jgi:PHD/YefM family antitoxin component YafN of YafNO toxin-antitoxin module